ncbi:MAG: hypothetical protein WA843_05125, partial [Candidatus Saccharimonadales bacterium]
VGQATLVADGHIRFSPDAKDVLDNNLLDSYTGASEIYKVVVTNPFRIKVDGGGAPSWYINSLPNGQEVFVNGNALTESNLDCSVVAHSTDPVGTIEIR